MADRDNTSISTNVIVGDTNYAESSDTDDRISGSPDPDQRDPESPDPDQKDTKKYFTEKLTDDNKKIFECDICHTTRASKQNIITHIQSKHGKHGGSVEAKCTKCDKSFPGRAYLTLHMKKHNHPCTQCHASFQTQRSLQVQCFIICKKKAIVKSCMPIGGVGWGDSLW